MTESQKQVKGANYSYVTTTPVLNPRIISLSEKVLNDTVEVTKDEIMQNEDEWAQILSGNVLLEGSRPIAHCYCGHQFGVFAGQLGDGRAITLGDIENSKGEVWELQLKGAGKTPYSRFADGRAVLRSSIREFLCSEAMHALGIPTTRAASIITSDTTVVRDLLYDGHPIDENCAIVMRLAPTFIRFGSFEICLPKNRYSGSSGPSHGMADELLPKLLEYTINHLKSFGKLNMHTDLAILPEDTPKESIYFEAFKEITIRTAETVAKWQGAGFCHGVLNTDNMSILGLTIDYGPFGFMDHFNPDHVCNHSDKDGRYSYDNQPSMCKWNLFKLADALKEYIPDSTQYVQDHFDLVYTNFFMQEFKQKLGFRKLQEGDLKLFQTMYATIKQGGFDWTNFFRYLSFISVPESIEAASDFTNIQTRIDKLFSFRTKKDIKCRLNKPKYKKLQLQKLKEIMEQNPGILRMVGHDPAAIERELQKDEEYTKLLETEENEIDNDIKENLIQWLEVYRIRLYKDFENREDSNETLEQFSISRSEQMLSKNPKFVLRNHLAEECIKNAEEGDYEMLNKLLYVLENPYEEHEDVPEHWSAIIPKSALDICVSCSS